MVLRSEEARGLSDGDKKFLRIIEDFGWHVVCVAPRVESGDKEEWWGYSTGLFYRFQQPEIILFGLDSETTIHIINLVGNAMKAGTVIQPDREYSDFFEGCSCIFKLLSETRAGEEYLAWSQWFYEYQAFPAFQLFWPDKDGRFPWEPQCNEAVKALQPLLCDPPESLDSSTVTAGR